MRWHILWLFLFSLSAQAKTSFVTFPIPLMVESSTEGVFIDLTRDIAQRSKTDVKIDVLPTGNAILKFTTGEADGFFPALDVYTPKNSVRTVPFYEKVDYVFYRKVKPLKSIKDLEGKKVGLTFRYPYAVELTSNRRIKFVFSDDDVSNMKKLADGAIDAFVVEERSGVRALELSRAKGIAFDSENPLSRQEVYYAFKDTEGGRRMAKSFSEIIQQMKKDGSLDKLLSYRKKSE
ncbi:substrate-binding periplasmic protein [Bdellovibrio sp. HCB274]|uniref:substrate-binding periplasmic protein n=1 Tax=Bdellovibrio sp. HCB274 TaxID=3394361 RepID=UPI0039B3FB95